MNLTRTMAPAQSNHSESSSANSTISATSSPTFTRPSVTQNSGASDITDDLDSIGRYSLVPHVTLSILLLAIAVASFVRYYRSARRRHKKRKLAIAATVRQQLLEARRKRRGQGQGQRGPPARYHVIGAFIDSAIIVNEVLRKAGICTRLAHSSNVGVNVDMVIRQYLIERATQPHACLVVYDVIDGKLQPSRLEKSVQYHELSEYTPLVEEQSERTAFSGRRLLTSQSLDIASPTQKFPAPHWLGRKPMGLNFNMTHSQSS